MMLNNMVRNFKLAMGQILLANMKAPIDRNKLKIMSGRMILNKEIPALFIAVSSLFSDKAPNVMMLDIRMASGNAIFTMRALAKMSSLKITHTPNPLPTNSSRYNQMVCISKMNIATINVTMNGPM